MPFFYHRLHGLEMDFADLLIKQRCKILGNIKFDESTASQSSA